MVRPASRMLRAISFGVFCRSAPSTSAIMRSRKVSPGFDVIRTLIWSESTRVPPVTAERSPPASRITGADSPVIADSSTEATPAMISPSPGINSPAETITISPFRSFVAATVCVCPSGSSLCAVVSVLVLRRLSACAFPRPSAIASAQLAKSTVNQSQSVICKSKPTLGAPVMMSRTSKIEVITLPISTTNITGFFIIVTGFSLLKESPIAREMIFASQMEIAFSLAIVFSKFKLESLPCVHQEMLHNRAKAQDREKGQSTDNQDHAHQKRREERCRDRERAERGRDALLPPETSSQSEHRDDHQETPKEHGDADRRVVPISIGRDAR